MKQILMMLLLLSIHVLLGGGREALAAQSGLQPNGASAPAAQWNSDNVQHLYGLPDAKANEKGVLAIQTNELSFTGKSSHSAIPLGSIIAVGAGNQRVELWGVKGRILRMAIPEGGGLVAATFLHHRVDMLTVEFSDSKGAYRSAVFILPASDADGAVQAFSKMPMIPRAVESSVCQSGEVKPRTVLVSAPNWDQAKVPVAYRSLVYEHLINRLQHAKGVDQVYRDGEAAPQQGCPQYTIQLTITGFKTGSQVQRAWSGPAGMFLGTTQMVFDATITDATGKLNVHEQTKATVRGESESINVVDAVAKKLTKQFSAAQKKLGETNSLAESKNSHTH